MIGDGGNEQRSTSVSFGISGIFINPYGNCTHACAKTLMNSSMIVGAGLRVASSFGRPDCKNSPQSHIVKVYDAGHGKSGVFHSAEWHDGDWSNDGIREDWLWCFIWVESFLSFFLTELRGCSLIGCWIKEQGTEQGTLRTPCRHRVFVGKGLVNSKSEGTISEIGVNESVETALGFGGSTACLKLKFKNTGLWSEERSSMELIVKGEVKEVSSSVSIILTIPCVMRGVKISEENTITSFTVVKIVTGVTLRYTLTIIALNSDTEAGSYLGEFLANYGHLDFVVFFDEEHDGWRELILRGVLIGRIIRGVICGYFTGDARFLPPATGPVFSRLFI
ncbi:hypothetical protein TNCV_4084881 [Trichonephila clavipes]|nr:hypothetical protein TNCV_4084881 [Trichonephila clavipes]